MTRDPAIAISNLSYRYPDGTSALSGIDLEVKRGEFLSVMGRNGSGKSTLCLFLNGIIPRVIGGKVRGHVSVFGQDTFEHHVYELAQQVGVVLQDPETQLFTSNIRSEVAFAGENLGMPREELVERVAWALEVVRLADIGEDVAPGQLSGGQKQRFAIAASLVVRPSLIVLDEPTSQLDPLGAAEVFSVLRSLNDELGVTVVLATHKSEEAAESSDRIVILEAGTIACQGSPAEVFSRVELLRSLQVKVPGVTQVEWELGLRRASGTLSVTLPERVRLLSDLLDSGEIRPSRDFDDASGPAGGSGGNPGQQPAVRDHRQASLDVSLTEVCFAYEGSKRNVVDHANLEVRPGEFLGLIGQNGAGKSTLAKLILGLVLPNSGEVRVNGLSTKERRTEELGLYAGLVLQNPDHQLFALSTREEVAFGLNHRGLDHEQVEERVESALKSVGLWEQRDVHPSNLSFADRRKLSVAAVAVMRPRVLIFDEPSTGQDHEGRHALANIARELNGSGTTVIMISHDMDLIAEYTSRLVVMGCGQRIGDGRTSELLRDTDLLAGTFSAPPQVISLTLALSRFSGNATVLTASGFRGLFTTNARV